MIPQWRRVRLKHLVEVQAGTWGEEPGELDADVLCVRAADFDRQRLRVKLDRLPLRSVELNTLLRLELRRGDIVLEKSGGGSDQPVGGSVLFDLDVTAICSNFAARLRPKSSVDPRFIVYLMSWMYSRGVTAAAAKQTTGIANLDMDWYLGTECLVPDCDQQALIADYLDLETTRIDRLIRRRAFMAELVQEKEQARLALLLGDWRTVPTATLRQLRTRVVTGPFGTQLAASEYVRGGVPVINPTHITDGGLVSDLEVAVPPEVARRLDRHRLDVGDIVMGRKGDVGRAAVVGPTEAGWVCGSDSIAIRTSREILLPQYLGVALASGYYRQQLDAQSTGAMVASINESTLLAFRIPMIPITEQRHLIDAGQVAQSQRARMVGLLREQAIRMDERRRALIAAAVTGQLKIPGVAA